VPSVGSSFRVGIVEVDGDHIVRLAVGVALREDEYTPEGGDEGK
jgi:hypothetical protein